MQPESDSAPTFIIAADGKCPDPADKNLRQLDDLKTIKLIIDGKQLLSGAHPDTLLGNNSDYLPQSRHYQLSHFEPLDNGRCSLHYTAV